MSSDDVSNSTVATVSNQEVEFYLANTEKCSETQWNFPVQLYKI